VASNAGIGGPFSPVPYTVTIDPAGTPWHRPNGIKRASSRSSPAAKAGIRDREITRPRADAPSFQRREFVSGYLVIYGALTSAESFSIAATAAGPALYSQ
jgi:hypothetical protein